MNAQPIDAPGPSEPDLRDPDVVTDLFGAAAEANRSAGHRHGSTAHLPNDQSLLMTGDLHDHDLNYRRICRLAALDNAPDRHLVLHEIVHGPNLVNGMDLSIRTLARVAALKVRYPDQVHLLQSNHELAQLRGEGISKDGVSVVDRFDEGVEFIYGDRADDVRGAMEDYIRSLLLAVRCPNGVLCSHSVPSPRALERFDFDVLDREPTDDDLDARGSGREMVWGRNHTPEVIAELAERWNVAQFVLGHQPAEMGYYVETDAALVLASDHAHGVALPLSTSKSYDMDGLVESIVPLASVVVK